MTDWVETECRKRIEDGEAKYGPWTAENFRLTNRNGVNEAIPELLDCINYLEMSYQRHEISISEFKYYEVILTDICERLKRRAT